MSSRDGRPETEVLDESVFAAWAAALPSVAPPSSLRERVLARVHKTVPENPLRTVRAADGWVEFAPGVTFKMLYRDASSGTNSLLARLQPGVTMREHDHGGIEECYVIHGEVTYGDLTIRAGDYHLAAKGAHHLPMTTATGALIFLRVAMGQHVPEAEVQ
jgi:anti-sigma factor ChrR (cupin superfamily)